MESLDEYEEYNYGDEWGYGPVPPSSCYGKGKGKFSSFRRPKGKGKGKGKSPSYNRFPKGKGKSKGFPREPRPSYEAEAAHFGKGKGKSKGKGTAAGRSSGMMGCSTCGSANHVDRDCPWSGPPSKGSSPAKGKGKDKGKESHLAMSSSSSQASTAVTYVNPAPVTRTFLARPGLENTDTRGPKTPPTFPASDSRKPVRSLRGSTS